MYIGKTEHPNPIDRWKEHLEDMKRESCKTRPFYRALNKYGVENFNFEVIDNTDNADDLCELEKYYIEKYRTYVHFENSNGYNCTLGGDGRQTRFFNEQEVIEYYYNNDMSVDKTSKHYDCDYRVINRILDANGIKRLSLREYIRNNYIVVYGGLVQMNLDKNKILQIYNHPKEVYEKYPDYKESGLSDAYRLNHKTHKYKGYTWYRLNELPEEYKPLLDEYYNSQTSPN